MTWASCFKLLPWN